MHFPYYIVSDSQSEFYNSAIFLPKFTSPSDESYVTSQDRPDHSHTNLNDQSNDHFNHSHTDQFNHFHDEPDNTDSSDNTLDISVPIKNSTRTKTTPHYLKDYVCATSKNNHWCNIISSSSYYVPHKAFLSQVFTISEPAN